MRVKANVKNSNKVESATSHDKTFNAHSKTTCLIHSDLFTVLKSEYEMNKIHSMSVCKHINK